MHTSLTKEPGSQGSWDRFNDLEKSITDPDGEPGAPRLHFTLPLIHQVLLSISPLCALRTINETHRANAYIVLTLCQTLSLYLSSFDPPNNFPVRKKRHHWELGHQKWWRERADFWRTENFHTQRGKITFLEEWQHWHCVNKHALSPGWQTLLILCAFQIYM